MLAFTIPGMTKCPSAGHGNERMDAFGNSMIIVAKKRPSERAEEKEERD